MASKNLILTLLCVSALTLVAVGCGGDDDAPATSNPVVPPVDTAPPALPSGLTVDYSARQHSATISWDQNVTDSDFEGFLVSRASYDQDPVEVVDQPQAVNWYQDAGLETAGRQVTYYVYSVDENGNVSAAATIDLNLEVSDNPDPEGVVY